MGAIEKVSGFFKDVFLIDDNTEPAALMVGSNRGSTYNVGGGSKWPYGLSSSGSSPIIDHQLMRQNARSAYHDSVQAKALVDRTADIVVDTGLFLEPDPIVGILGIDPEQARLWSDNVASRFHLYAKSKKMCRDETLNFYQIQRLIEITQQRDNDYFVRFFYSNRSDLLNPLQIQLIDANQINGYGFTSTYGFQQNYVGGITDTQGFQSNFVDGIKRDAAGREIAYKVFIYKTDGSYEEKIIPAVGPRSGQRLMIHGFNPEYPGQGRGYSRIGHMVQEFENLTDFKSAQIKKAIMQSSIYGFNKPSKDAPATDPFEEIQQQYGAGPVPSELAQGVTEESTLALSDYVQYVPLPEATITQPGTVGIFNLQSGEELKPFGSTAPADRFDTFVDAFTSYLAASVSMPLEVMLMKFNQNYSASRAALVLFWRVAEIWRAELEVDILNPVYEAWLTGEIASGRITAPGWNDPRLRAAWLNNEWFGRPMPDIDPLKTMNANKGYAEIGAVDLDRLARNHNGSSGKLNRAKLAKQYEELSPAPWANKGNSDTKTDEKDD